MNDQPLPPGDVTLEGMLDKCPGSIVLKSSQGGVAMLLWHIACLFSDFSQTKLVSESRADPTRRIQWGRALVGPPGLCPEIPIRPIRPFPVQ
jgi:hypothetical protein